MRGKIMIILAVLFFTVNNKLYSEVISVKSKETLTVVELNKGDKVNFTLINGRTVSFELINCRVNIIFTTLDTLKKSGAMECTLYSMSCNVKIDGQEMKMVKYVPVQETYHKPYVVNGLTIWFDALKELSEYFNENHGKCTPAKDARFAFHDAGLQICPQELSNWYPVPENQIFIKDGYRGADSWLGTYYGADLHGGLDVNMPSNTPIIAPIDFDEHYFFNSLETGHHNNRWRGVRYWDNGDIWQLQVHHINELLVPQYQKLKQGQTYAHGAGVWCWYSPHSHFVFNVYQPEFQTWTLMDPWIIFWQIFENNKKKANLIRANIEPVAPAETGQKVFFSSKGSTPSIYGSEFEYFWSFGDGYTAITENPVHIFQNPGIYPITLTVRNGFSIASYTQHISVSGENINVTSFKITTEDEPSYRTRENWKTSTYGTDAGILNTLIFRSYQDSEHALEPKTVSIWFHKFAAEDSTNYPDDLYTIPQAVLPVYKHGNDWLDIERIPYDDHVDLKIKPNLDKVIVKWGLYEAYILINHDDAINAPQYIRVKLDFSYEQPGSSVIVDNLDKDCIKSDYFWLSPEHHWNISEGYNKNYCINAENKNGEFIRYIPNLAEGLYDVSLFGTAYQNTELAKKMGSFYVIVKHLNGTNKIKVEPQKSLYIGQFEFANGREGYVEIISDGAVGLILADAIKFQKKN